MTFTYPLQGKTFQKTSAFGKRWGDNHNGIDLKADSGTPVVAVADGEVIKSDNKDEKGYGGQILLKHKIDGNTFYTRYAHLKEYHKGPGETVKKGEVIGKSGGGPNDKNKGRATGPHLHFEVLDDVSSPIDPEPFLTGAAVLATTGDNNKDKDKDKDIDPYEKSNAESIPDKIMKAFYKGYGPASLFAAVPGLSQPKESEIPKPILEEIDRIKELLK